MKNKNIDPLTMKQNFVSILTLNAYIEFLKEQNHDVSVLETVSKDVSCLLSKEYNLLKENKKLKSEIRKLKKVLKNA